MLVVGILLGGWFMWVFYVRYRKNPCPETPASPKIGVTMEDILRLVSLNNSASLHALLLQYRIHVKMPEFYEKYQAANKKEKEFYFDELITIFARNREEEMQDLYENYPGLSSQDVLLWLLMEAHLDNKTIARILEISFEALKKRKSRLKSKMQLDTVSMKVENNA